jgi:hypothetical protein
VLHGLKHHMHRLQQQQQQEGASARFKRDKEHQQKRQIDCCCAAGPEGPVMSSVQPWQQQPGGGYFSLNQEPPGRTRKSINRSRCLLPCCRACWTVRQQCLQCMVHQGARQDVTQKRFEGHAVLPRCKEPLTKSKEKNWLE